MKITFGMPCWALVYSAINAILFAASTEAAATLNRPVWQVAVVGAGAAGSSAAYYLQKFANDSGIDVNITVFERTGRVGGRTLTVNAFDDPRYPVELGASVFVKENHVLFNATQKFNLATGAFEDEEDDGEMLGVWDGDKFLFTQDTTNSSWWNMFWLIWKYGVSAPRALQKVKAATQASFHKLYKAPYFPFRSLTQRVYELGLEQALGHTGAQFLKLHSVGDPFGHDIVQASTRVNYASNLAYIHGLGTMVSMSPENAMSIVGGNYRIFESMLNSSSKANLLLNTAVGSLGRDGSDTNRYTIQTKPTGLEDSSLAEYPISFDKIVIATPWQFADITSLDDVVQHPIDSIPYAKLHVTLFTSPFPYSAKFFNLTEKDKVPNAVLTTLAETDGPSSGLQGVGKAGFYSATYHQKLINPKTGLSEYQYKIFSPEPVTPEFLSDLLGAPVPDTFVATPRDGEDPSDTIDTIGWYYSHMFYSYPRMAPRVTLQDPIVGDGIFYTSGVESFISTMETSGLMGMNVAQLIVDELVGVIPPKGWTAPWMPSDGLVAEESSQDEQSILREQQEREKELWGEERARQEMREQYRLAREGKTVGADGNAFDEL